MIYKQVAEGSASVRIVRPRTLIETSRSAWRSYQDAVAQHRALLAFEVLGVGMPGINGVLWGILVGLMSSYAEATGVVALLWLVQKGVTAPLNTFANLYDLRDQLYAHDVETQTHAGHRQVQLRQIQFHRRAERDFLMAVGLMALVYLVSAGVFSSAPWLLVGAYAGYWFFIARSNMRSSQVGQEAVFAHYQQRPAESIAQYRFMQEWFRTLALGTGLMAGWLVELGFARQGQYPHAVVLALMFCMAGASFGFHKLLERYEMQQVIEVFDLTWLQSLNLPSEGVFGDHAGHVFVEPDSPAYRMMANWLTNQAGLSCRKQAGLVTWYLNGKPLCRLYALPWLNSNKSGSSLL